MNFMKTKNEIERPSLETLRRGRRVTPAEHEKYSQALDEKYGIDRPRVGRPSLGALKARDIHLRIPPGILERLRTKAAKLGIGYQTLIKQILSRAA
jgi:predicted DNA binding CopG/RHH family protein